MAKKKSRKVYPLETKLEAIRLREEEGLLYREITEKLEIRDPERVRVWMRIYRREGIRGLKKPRRGRPKKDRDSIEARIKQLEMENTLLKALAIELGEELPEGLDIEPYTDIKGHLE
ncbi:MAG: helix-turn-helix domain-containing protein [Proteobacteria bacterium]|jgi:transposase|nr:helix-turn-helix domain-containing protein [Pseudomonadota bacterium]